MKHLSLIILLVTLICGIVVATPPPPNYVLNDTNNGAVVPKKEKLKSADFSFMGLDGYYLNGKFTVTNYSNKTVKGLDYMLIYTEYNKFGDVQKRWTSDLHQESIPPILEGRTSKVRLDLMIQKLPLPLNTDLYIEAELYIMGYFY